MRLLLLPLCLIPALLTASATDLPIDYVVPQRGQASVQILDQQGNILRNLVPPHTSEPGKYSTAWDGTDDAARPMAPGEYRVRITVNPADYITAMPIGSSAQPPTRNQNPHHLESVAVDTEGHVYTANLWEEAAQDFRKWDRETGNHLYNSEASIRNGNPNALPYAIAVDEKYLYCATHSHQKHYQQHVRRFHLADGKPAPFPNAEHILLHEDPTREFPADASEELKELLKMPLRALAVSGETLYVADAVADRVWKFDRETGAEQGFIPVKLPHALAVDSTGKIWIGHEDSRISMLEGNTLRSAGEVRGHIRAMAFGPKDTLHVADSRLNQISLYQTEADGLKYLRSFGGAAKPGDYSPDQFYKLVGLAVDRAGNVITAQNFPLAGARLTRFAPNGKVLWDHVGGEFCSTGNYLTERPDELISHYLNRYNLDRRNNTWEFRGCVLDGDPKYLYHHHGPLRRLRLNNQEYLFQSYGDGLQVYRRSGDSFRPSAMFGRNNPLPDGRYRDEIPENIRPAEGDVWSWRDLDGNGKVEEAEVKWYPKQELKYVNYGLSVDRFGNALMCNDGVTEVPLSGFDEHGNPIYDLTKERSIFRRDGSEKSVVFEPVMAVRAEDGSIFVQAKSRYYPKPKEADGGWMAGWVLAKYDGEGRLLWNQKLPEACPGMDVIPGGGVALVTIKWKEHGCEIYHYATDGAWLGVTWPDESVRGFGGIPDNTGSLSANRNPEDGMVDLFVEDCVGNRMRWQRIDDRKKPVVQMSRVVLP